MSDEIHDKIRDLDRRVLILEQWRLYAQGRNASVPTWAAITVTGLLGVAGLLYQMLAARGGP
jgi:hypothetical protein